MKDTGDKIEQLQIRLENLVSSQESFQREISQLRYEISVLRQVQQKRQKLEEEKISAEQTPTPSTVYIPPTRAAENTADEKWENSSTQTAEPTREAPKQQQRANQIFGVTDTTHSEANFQAEIKFEKSDLEKFIGENLINKIGIVILVLGVAIGAKYAVDNNLISPLMRIVFGYFFGIALTGLAVRLKPKYHNFSAVLLSGGMAIMFFITYAAYGYYDLISQTSAFFLMLMFTAFTVATALIYDRVVIAHIGLVGAYAIPFLLSDNSGRAAFLFTYTAIINAGILAISVKKYCKSLFYSSFIITWLIFGGWFIDRYHAAEHFNIALIFSTVFFLVFYLTFLSYKTFFREEISAENIILVLANTFIYYGFGSAAINSLENGNEFLGIFTIANAGLHFVVAFLISRFALVEKSVVFLPSALFPAFITIAVPVELNGNQIVLAWTAQAAILFAVGRIKQLPLYEYFSYPLMALSCIGLLDAWAEQARNYFLNDTAQFPIFNSYFLTTILFVAGFAFIYRLDRNEKYFSALNEDLQKLVGFAVPTVLLIALYNAFRIEIGNYFHYEIVQNALSGGERQAVLNNSDLEIFNIIWQTNYTMFFLSMLALANIKKFRSPALGFVNLGLNALVLFFFLTVNLFLLGELREGYLLESSANAGNPGIFHILIRYVSLCFVAGLIFSIYKYFRQEFIQKYVAGEFLNYAFDFAFYFSLLIVFSTELINWMDIFGYKEAYKLGLSILWGFYSLCLVIIGIVQHKKHLRFGAIALFALTLVKLFLYDIARLDTISKTVVFVSLGILLLIISFLYNKYKNLIFETNEV